jgi:hypothetical protein
VTLEDEYRALAVEGDIVRSDTLDVVETTTAKR